ncbi:hypothetical protein AAMO2058_001557200 [Amorphochlora amoebiformis]
MYSYGRVSTQSSARSCFSSTSSLDSVAFLKTKLGPLMDIKHGDKSVLPMVYYLSGQEVEELEKTNENKMFIAHRQDLFSVECNSISATRSRLLGLQISPVHYGREGSFAMQLNHGWFQNNGGCGFILKPQWLREGHAPPKRSGELSVSVISGHFLPVRRGRENLSNVVVRVRLIGAPEDEKEYKTIPVEGSLKPKWGEVDSKNPMRFQVSRPEIGVVHLVVEFLTEEKRVKTIAQASAPITCIEKGYRIVPLYDVQCRPVFGFLFVRIRNDFVS